MTPKKAKSPEPTKAQGTSKENQIRADFNAAPGATQGAEGINPFARFRAVWAACITPAGRKLVLLALTDFSDADGTNIRPAVATVAACCNISAKQTRRHIHDLVELGVIKITRVAAQHRAATYALDLSALSALPQAGALENASTPMGVPQHSHGCPSDLPPMGDYPGNTRGKTPRAGGGGSSGPGFAGPKGLDPAIWAKWVKKAKLDSDEISERVAEGEELRAKGEDLNKLAKRAIANKWRLWPWVGAKIGARGSRYGEDYPGKKWGMPS